MANIDISKLPPALQQALFQASQQTGQQPTTNMGEAAPASSFNGGYRTPDPQAQQGVGQMDGADIHPAIHQIAAQMGLSPVQQGHPAPQQPSAYPTSPPVDHSNDPFIDKYMNFMSMGLANRVKDSQPNYYSTLKKIGATDLLPGNLKTDANGNPIVPEGIFKTIAASRQLPSGNNPQLDKDTALALKIVTPDQADQLYKNPGQQIGLNELRLGVLASTANSKAGTLALGRTKFEQQQINDLIKGISDAQASNSTPMGQQANKLNAVIHARQILSGAFDPSTNQYDIPTAASKEVIMGVARAISPSGQIPEQTQKELDSPNAYNRMAGLIQYWTGKPVNAEPGDIIKMYRGMLDRQGAISQDLFNASAARELPKGLLLQKSNPLAYAAVVQNSFGTHDYRAMIANSPDGAVSQVPQQLNLGGRGTQPPPVTPSTSPSQTLPQPPQPPQSSQPPQPQLHFNSPVDIKAAYQAGKLTIDQAKALVKSMHKGGN